MTQDLQNTSTNRILRIADLMERTGLSRSNIYNKMNSESSYFDASFPKQVKLGKGAVGWLESDIDAWIAQRFSKDSSGSPPLPPKIRPPSSSKNKPEIIEVPIATIEKPVPPSVKSTKKSATLSVSGVTYQVNRKKAVTLTKDGKVISKL